jgi:hypothetical protein
MIPTNTSGNATIEGMNSGKGFNIKGSAKAFKILSSGIYKNKILAPIRELSTNALDAHDLYRKMHNLDVYNPKFIVHLPNSLDPYFSVRDFGPGLSPAQVQGDEANGIESIYTTYFLSTKETDADAIGCLGLGTKSPFAYTSSFSVTSYYGGKKSVYALYLDGDMPTVSLVGSEDSGELTGLEVSFGVNSYDFSQFRSETEKLYSFWEDDKRPEVTGQKLNYQNYLSGKTSGNGWMLSDESNTGVFNRGYFHVVMGGIAYKVNVHDGPNQAFLDISDYSHLIFQCELGEVNFTASREELELDSHTVPAIVKRIKDFKQSIIVSLDEQVDKAGSLWNARILAHKFKSQHKLLKLHTFKYHGMVMNEKINFRKFPQTLYKRRHGYVKFTSSTINSLMASEMTSNENIMFLYNDLEKPHHTSARVNNYLKTHKNVERAILINGMSIATVKRTFGVSNAQITKVSNLPIPDRIQRVRSSIELTVDEQIEFHNKNILTWNGWKFNKGTVRKGQNVYYYVDCKSKTAQYDDKDISNFNDVVTFMKICTDLKINEVYGVRQPAKKLINQSGKWVNLYDLFKAELKKYLDNNPVSEYASKEYIRNKVLNNLTNIVETLNLNPVTENCEINTRIAKLSSQLTIPSTFSWSLNYETLRALSYHIGVNLPYGSSVDCSAYSIEAQNIRHDYAKQFPLMEYFSYRREAKVEYLRLWVIDQESKALNNTVQVSQCEDEDTLLVG